MRKYFSFIPMLLIILISCSKSDSPAEPSTPEPPGGPQNQKDIAAVDRAVESMMNTYAIPGVSVAITKDGKLVYAKSYGKMSNGDNTPVTNASLYRIASISKPITGVGIMKLMEANKLTLDTKVFGASGLLGSDYPAAPAALNDITVRHLLHHTVGAWGNDAKDPMFKQPNYDHKQLIKWTLENYPATTGRGTYSYSNFGYCLLGRIIEKLSGKSYEAFTKEQVLAPCGITNMQIGGSTLAERKPGEVIYNAQSGQNAYLYNVPRMDAHGGWIASATDLARFMVKVDGFPSKPDILKPATITAMVTRSVPSSNYASGWSVNNANHWWHTGALPGTATEIIRSNGGFTWVVLCNSRSTNANFNNALDGLLWPVILDSKTAWQDIDQF
ncbi:MAG: class A beta-lactamase-related serine hydrolase [Chitinophagaceae bacterium]|nr:MAG: class A beta-lactamase-related serine hydrolase [Chitinophagaceae bacterium]